jgi:hypothetical protein
MGVSNALDGWTPVRLHQGSAGLGIDWCYTDGYEFDDPFFDQTIQRCMREPARLLFRRSVPLSAIADADAPAPTGLIAHMSRCGSTMVSQALGARGDVLSWSEAPIIDQVVRAASAGQCGLDALRGVLALPASRGRPYSVVKLDAWTSLDLSLVRAAAPDVPIVMLVRDPLEVFVSQSRRRGFHMIPGALPPHVVGLRPDQVQQIELDEYGAMMLGRILEVAHHTLAHDERSMVIDYADLPEALDRITELFGLTSSADQLERMRIAATRDAKNPALSFVGDASEKQAAATEQMREAIDRWARPWYERLLVLRGR